MRLLGGQPLLLDNDQEDLTPPDSNKKKFFLTPLWGRISQRVVGGRDITFLACVVCTKVQIFHPFLPVKLDIFTLDTEMKRAMNEDRR